MDSWSDTSVGTSGQGVCRRVLLVDSTASSRAVTEMMLLAESYTLTATGSGIEALAILYEHEAEFDFVLTDIHLSDIDGFEFLDTLEEESDTIVFVLSADFRREVRVEASNMGVCRFFEKPIERRCIDELWRDALTEKLRRQSRETVKGKSPIDGDKARFIGIWTSTLHDQFVKIVKEIGLRYADPRKILEFMNVPGLAKKDVSDHLQTYFTSLMRMEQEAFDQQAQENKDCVSSSNRVWR